MWLECTLTVSLTSVVVPISASALVSVSEAETALVSLHTQLWESIALEHGIVFKSVNLTFELKKM